MDRYTSKELIEDTFENAFDKARFIKFARNLLNTFDTSKAFHARGYIQEKYKQAAGIIKTYERVGTYTDPEGNKIDILIVYLQKDDSIDRARTTLRNFVADYLKNRDEKEAGLVAFVSPDNQDWRFSFVKMEYHLVESPTGKIKAKEEFTPAKRYSFLVGVNESSHTAQRQLLPTLQDDKNNPLLSDLEKAFNIEVVTQEFFEKYKSLFLDVKDSLDLLMKKDQAIAKDFADKGVDPVDFSKKLLGQIVFLYFLQKKGWFGVGRDDNWGTGPKNFLRLLFEKMIANYKNFFNDILEPLFYEALAKERDDDFYSRFNCKIPFLNGGLFDPLSDYDWVHTDILLPDDLFSNHVRTKEGDIGTGILDIFDRYNFTVKEDEPLEKEVAVDPEMLGKVFENLLEVKDRKSKGTYYTPREIVHYMCQESLINYLLTELNSSSDGGRMDSSEVELVSRKDIETLIRFGESVVENEASALEKQRSIALGKQKTTSIKSKMPPSIIRNAQSIDLALINIRVCDPAIGSGAFPVGMMNEIIRTRNTLTNYLENKTDRSIYNFKRDAIQNSLYGVDIDPGAVEIAKLRLWLSLIVDEQDIKQIKPLPNLDYKIMQGNSLLEEFEGVRLFDEELISKPGLDDDEQIKTLKQKQSDLQHEFIKLYSSGGLNGSKKQQLDLELKKISDSLKRLNRPEKSKPENGNLFDIFSEAKKKAQELKQLHKEFFEASQKTRKAEIKRRIEKLEWELIETSLSEQNKISSLKKLEQYKKTNIKPFFLWRLNFAEVFAEKDGFDVVIANPPYGADFSNSEKETLKRVFSYSIKGKFESYRIFFEKGLNVLKSKGTLTYVTPNTWMSVEQALPLRKFFLNNLSFVGIVSFPQKTFDATVDSIVVVIENKLPVVNTKVEVIEIPLKEKVSNIGLYLDNKEYYSQTDWDGDQQIISYGTDSQDRKLIHKLLSKFDNFGRHIITKQGLIPYLTKKEGTENRYINSRKIDSNWKPYLDGSKRVGRYYIKPINAFIKYGNWLYAPREQWIFRKQRIIFQLIRNISLERRIIATYLIGELYSDRNTGLIFSRENSELNLKYIIAIFNSNLINFIHASTHNSTYISLPSIERLPIPLISQIKQKPLIEIVDKILAITSSSDYSTSPEKQAKVTDYERQIDQLVYKLYGLTPEEIAIVEGVKQ